MAVLNVELVVTASNERSSPSRSSAFKVVFIVSAVDIVKSGHSRAVAMLKKLVIVSPKVVFTTERPRRRNRQFR